MFLPGFRDLVKESWVKIIEELKISGGQPVSELSRRLETSYMGMKDQCEALLKAGWLERWRLPRKEVGRPEIMYRLAPKADSLFPQAGTALTLELLESSRQLFGDSAPERLLLQYFSRLREKLAPRLSKAKSLVEKAALLVELREKEGCFARCKYDPARGFRIEEYHNPLLPLFAVYPTAITLEVRMMEELLGSRMQRVVIPGGRAGPARIDYEVATLGVRQPQNLAQS